MSIVKTEQAISQLKFNRLTQEQYDAALLAGEINEDEFYLTPNKANSTLIIKADDGTNEGVNLYTYDGSTQKTINVKGDGGALNITARAGSLTFGVRDASTSQSGIVNTNAQTFAGAKTLTGATTINNTLTVSGKTTLSNDTNYSGADIYGGVVINGSSSASADNGLSIKNSVLEFINNGNTSSIGTPVTSSSYFNFKTSGTTFYFNKRIQTSGNILPYSADTDNNLGESSRRWKNAYIRENIYFNDNGTTNYINATDYTGNAATASRLNISSTDNAIVRFDGTQGAVQNSGLKIDDSDHLIFTSASYGTTLPTGGVEGQIFFKVNDGDTTFPSGGNAGQVLTKNTSANGDVIWADVDALPTGGTAGQYLQKTASGSQWATITMTDTKNTAGASNKTGSTLYIIGATSQANEIQTYSNSSVFINSNSVLMGAAWNDYAEYRNSDVLEPGRCIVENGNDTLSLSTSRLQPGAEIISDTFGFAIGQNENCQTPIAVSGRVLAYPYEPIEEFAKHIGAPVCSAPNGTVSIMTSEEERNYPSRIIGTISAIPDYETWGTGNVKVDGRIWIRVR